MAYIVLKRKSAEDRIFRTCREVAAYIEDDGSTEDFYDETGRKINFKEAWYALGGTHETVQPPGDAVPTSYWDAEDGKTMLFLTFLKDDGTSVY